MIAFLYDDGLVLFGPSHQMIAVALGKSLDKYRELLALILLVLPSADVGLQADELIESVSMREIIEVGAQDALMTLPTGCLGLLRGPSGDRVLYSVQIDQAVVETRSTVGSGDAFLAGFVAARYS